MFDILRYNYICSNTRYYTVVAWTSDQIKPGIEAPDSSGQLVH
jgi:hypothetical protein